MISTGCRKCGATPWADSVCLVRVNEKGVPGIWECSPTCGHIFKDQADAILHALDKTDSEAVNPHHPKEGNNNE